jgi:alkaline phosphatase D
VGTRKIKPGIVDRVPTFLLRTKQDDHDYGMNDGGADYVDREISQQIFLDFVEEPVHSPRRQQQGVYASYTVGQASVRALICSLGRYAHTILLVAGK